MVPERTVFFEFRLIKVHPRAYGCIINDKTKGKFPGKFFRDLNWENRTYKVKRCIGWALDCKVVDPDSIPCRTNTQGALK